MSRRQRKPLINTGYIALAAVSVAVTSWILLVHVISGAY